MALNRPCLQAGCNRYAKSGGMCPLHTAALKHQRDADRYLFAQMCREAKTCAVCGKPRTEDDPFAVDHITPLSAGGTSVPANLRVVHRSCNNSVRS